MAAARIASSDVRRFVARLGNCQTEQVPCGNRTAKRFLAMLLVAVAAAFAQQEGGDVGEYSLMTGTTFGGMGTHPSLSGSAGISLGRYVMVSADAGVIPIGSATLLPAGPVAIKGSDLFTFGISLQARIPVRRWEPYVLLEPALLVNSYLAGEATDFGRIDYRGNRHSKFGLEGGVGVRYYIKSKWGVRAEYCYISSAANFSEIKAGLFYQVEGYSGFHFRRDLKRLLDNSSDPQSRPPSSPISRH